MLSSSSWTPRANHDKPFCNAFERWNEIHSWYSWWLFAHVLLSRDWLTFTLFVILFLWPHHTLCKPLEEMKVPYLRALVLEPSFFHLDFGILWVCFWSYPFPSDSTHFEPLVRSGFALHIPHPLPVNNYSIFYIQSFQSIVSDPFVFASGNRGLGEAVQSRNGPSTQVTRLSLRGVSRPEGA
jgi:hypothetical protein